MKKIALAIENFSRYGGGAESYAVDIAGTLVKKGWEVHCYGVKWGGEPAGAIFHPISIPKLIPTWLKMLLFALKHKKMVQKEHFDIILGFGNTVYMNVYQSHGGVHWYSTMRKTYTEANALLRFIKIIFILLSPKHHVRHWIESAPFRQDNPPTIIAISDMIKSDLEKFFKLGKERIKLVYNGIDTSRFDRDGIQKYRKAKRKSLGIAENDIAFIFASYELKKKGVEPLVEAAGLLRQRGVLNFKVIVVGGPSYHGVNIIIKRFGLEDTVIFTGPSKAIQEMYAAADVFILPTYYDACSLVVLEAMACGLPPITTETNGIAGILNNGEEGYVISHPPDAQEISEKMGLLLDTERRNSFARKATRLSSKYTKNKNHRAIIEVLDEVTKKVNQSN